jgi:hypothetical protein
MNLHLQKCEIAAKVNFFSTDLLIFINLSPFQEVGWPWAELFAV